MIQKNLEPGCGFDLLRSRCLRRRPMRRRFLASGCCRCHRDDARDQNCATSGDLHKNVIFTSGSWKWNRKMGSYLNDHAEVTSDQQISAERGAESNELMGDGNRKSVETLTR